MERGAARLSAALARVALAGLVALAVACGDTAADDAAADGTAAGEAPATTSAAKTTPSAAAGCADVVDVEVTFVGNGGYDFAVTVRSHDTGWDKYADAWRVVAGDGTVLATRDLTHPHVDEQPFTRRLRGVVIPAGVSEVEVAARDLVEGFCGTTMRVGIPSHP